VELNRLARLLAQRNQIDAEIASITGSPALAGHLGEFIAAAVFGIVLQLSATNRGSDGAFTTGTLAGRSVNVKWYGKLEGILDLNADHPADFYLVLAGPRSAPTASRGGTRPAVISSVFLFQAALLHEELRAGGVKLGIATSVRRRLWDAAEIYPEQRNPALALTDDQRALLALFGPPTG